jgi:hypothetical protein
MRAIILLCLLALPALAQAQTTGQSGGPVPLPTWFVEIDTAKKGEVARADFLKHRMKSFDDLDTNKDGKVSLDEFLKLAEPPYSNDVPGGPSLEERRNAFRAEPAMEGGAVGEAEFSGFGTEARDLAAAC